MAGTIKTFVVSRLRERILYEYFCKRRRPSNITFGGEELRQINHIAR